MDAPCFCINFLDISPYVRFAHYTSDADKDNHIVPWRYIYDYEFIYIVRGSMEVQTDDETYTLNADDIHIMSPHIWHRRSIPNDQTCDYYSVHFDFLIMGEENDFSPEETYLRHCNKKNLRSAPVDERLYHRPLYVLGNIEMPKKLHISNSVAYTELLNHIVTASTEKAFAYEIDLKCYMLMLIKQILMDVRLHVISKNSNSQANLAAITQYILDNYQTNINFETLCHMYGYSYSNFSDLFKRYSGKSPHKFLTEVRIEKAAELLYSKQFSVTDIAFMVGYTDSSYFSRIFRKYKGCSPSAFINNSPRETNG
ncbi:MAG: AraC family transcriptional regulator [Acutalibacteraceae bacterium]